MNYILFTLYAAATFAILNVLDKYIITSWIRKPLVYTTAAMLINSWVLLLFIFRPLTNLSLPSVIFAVLSGVLVLLGAFCYTVAVSKEEATRVVALRQLTPAFVLLLSSIFLSEVLTGRMIFGFLFLLAGGFLVSLRNGRGRFISPVLPIVVLSSFLIAASLILLKKALVQLAYLDATLLAVAGSSFAALCLLLIPKNRIDVRNVVRLPLRVKMLLFAASVVAVLAMLLGSLALSTGPAPIVSSLYGFQPVFLLLFAILLSRFFP
ncbi:MAG: EamA family transporter, partial [Candidatus Woesearchaeota archaeon]